jgi:hypothetical protein
MQKAVTSFIFGLAVVGYAANSSAADLPLVDAHIHYSHDAWEGLPPAKAVVLLHKAGLKRAFVSSSSDRRTQLLYNATPHLIVPVLRPYRKRGELGSWMHDDSIIKLLETRLSTNKYAGIGGFHAYGNDVNTNVLRRVVSLAKQYGIFLHSHSDAAVIDGIFKKNLDARVLWAHSGSTDPTEIRSMLKKHKNLWSDLAFRDEHATDRKVDKAWRKLFQDFPNRFMIGTDTFAPERWFYVVEHANWSRAWPKDLPKSLAENIAWRNAMTLADWALKNKTVNN